MSDAFDVFSELGIDEPREPTTEEEYFESLTAGKMPKFHNCQYWVKHNLHVYIAFMHERKWLLTKASGPGRVQVSIKEVVRGLLQYYFEMYALAKFENARGEEQKKVLDMQKFLDLAIEYPTIKKLIDEPHNLL